MRLHFSVTLTLHVKSSGQIFLPIFFFFMIFSLGAIKAAHAAIHTIALFDSREIKRIGIRSYCIYHQRIHTQL